MRDAKYQSKPAITGRKPHKRQVQGKTTITKQKKTAQTSSARQNCNNKAKKTGAKRNCKSRVKTSNAKAKL